MGLGPSVRAPLDVALDRERLTAVLPDRPGAAPGQTVVVDLARGADPADGLTDALERLAERLPSRPYRLRVSLLPPLARARTLELPRMRDSELRLVVARDAARYFAGATAPQLAAVQRLDGARGAPAPVLAAIAPRTLVEALHVAAASVGWRVQMVVPAQAAWAAAGWHARGDATSTAVAVVLPERVELLEVAGGRLTTTRSFPPGGGAGLSAALAAGGVPPLLVADAGAEAPALPAVFSGGAADALPPAWSAAAFAGRAHGLRFRTVAEEAAAGRIRRRQTLAAGALAAALMAAAAAVELGGAHRHLDDVAARRAEIAERVAEVSTVREFMAGIDAWLDAAAERERTSRPWAEVIATLAEHLPGDAHLTTLRAIGDTLYLEGAAENAARTFEALRSLPDAEAVRTESPIRRDSDGVSQIERFHLKVALRTRVRDVAPGDVP